MATFWVQEHLFYGLHCSSGLDSSDKKLFLLRNAKILKLRRNATWAKVSARIIKLYADDQEASGFKWILGKYSERPKTVLTSPIHFASHPDVMAAPEVDSGHLAEAKEPAYQLRSTKRSKKSAGASE